MNIKSLPGRIERARQICKRRGITQVEIATALGASQSQVSRILHAKGLRATRLSEEVCMYVERYEGGVTASAVRNNDALIDALASTWDGSAKHANALALVIRSLCALGTSPETACKGLK